VMTTDELTDIRSIAAAVGRIEQRMDRQEQRETERDKRINLLEKVSDQTMAVLTFVKWLLSFIGIGGLALVVAALLGRL
jgi:hypothetical protein